MTRPTRLSHRNFRRSLKTARGATFGLLLAGLLPLCAAAAAPLQSERGAVPIEGSSPIEQYRIERDRDPIPRNYEQQPPLIPHTVKGYNITQNFNKCMDCHAWSRVKETKATKVSLSHFKTREGTELANISPRRYFCMQCHVPQFDAKPLVENTYQSAPTKKTK
jgi:cytochrome c-type protein NapB